MISDAADVQLAAQFAATRASTGDEQDWQDVLRRVSEAPSTRMRTAFLVAGLIVIVASTATLALGGTLQGWFFGTPAPPLIRRAFIQQNRASAAIRRWQKAHSLRPFAPPGQVDVAKAHGVMAVNTPDGLLMLWVAPPAGPAKTQGDCYFVDFARDQTHRVHATGSGTCLGVAAPPSKIQWGYGWTIAHPSLKELSGRLYVDAATIVVHSAGSPPRRVPVVDRYFLAAFPRSVKTPTQLDAFDRHGHLVARYVRRR